VARQLITPPSQIPTHPSRRGEHRTDAQSGHALLWQLISDARHAVAHTFDFWANAPTDDSDDKRAGYIRFKRSLGGQVKEYAGTWDLPIHAMKYSPYRAVNFQQYIHIDRSLKPPLMRPSLVLVRKAIDRMWFRRHWYWPSGYIVVGIIVALLTNNIHLSSLPGILLSILAVLLWPFILGAALCRLLGFHIPGIDIT